MLLVSANVAVGMLHRIADLVNRPERHEDLDRSDLLTRVLPAIADALDGWTDARQLWRALAPATSGIPREVALAAHHLYAALHDPALDIDPASYRVVPVAVMALVEAAHLNLQAARRGDLKGAASGVAQLTRQVFENVPGARSLDLWHQLERLDGPALIHIPTPVRGELLHSAAAILSVTTSAGSATYDLSLATRVDHGAGHRTLRPQTALAIGSWRATTARAGHARHPRDAT